MAETVSVLFTDLVGSTETLTRLGEDATELLRREYFALLRVGAERHAGREVKNLGDGLMFVFPSASACIAGGAAIQQTIEARNRAAAEPLQVRAGGSTGDADVENGDYFGVAVVEAARLCAHAKGGQVLVGEGMRILGRDRSGHELASVGLLDLKGFDESVAAWEVVWAPLDTQTHSVPLPVRLERETPNGFVGRTAEVETLNDALKRVGASRQRQVLLLSGEAGIGKTTLVSRFAREAFDAGAVVLYGRCDEELGLPYQPWLEALDHLVQHMSGDVLGAHVDARGGDLSPLAASLSERGPDLPPPRSDDPDTSRHLLFGAVVDLLTRASENRVVVVVLDDLHWADRTTVQLLRHVALSAETASIVLLGTFRDTDVGPSHPLTDLLAALHREDGVERVTLRGLDDFELADFMEFAAGHALDAEALELRDALMAETSGNPFFASEMLRHLAETGAIAPGSDGRWQAQIDLRAVGLPVSVREVVGRRVARLGDDALRVLAAAAVLGREFDLEVLAAVVEIDEDRVLELLDQAASASVVNEIPGSDDRYTFVHALIQHTLYHELGSARRRRLHRRVAEALEQRAHGSDAHLAELARHWYEATRPEDVEKAYGYALRAGDQAQERLAPDEAVRWYSQALELVERFDDDGARRADCLIRLGTAQRLAGAPQYRETLLEAAHVAQARGDADQLCRAALANFRGFFSITGSTDRERIATLDAALEGLDDDPALRVRLLARLATETFFARDRSAAEILDEALVIADDCDDVDVKLDALLALMTYYVPGNLAQRLARLPEMLELASQSDDPARRFWIRLGCLLAQVQTGDLTAAASSLDELRGLSDVLGDPATRWTLNMGIQMLTTLAGDLDEAEHLAQRTLELGIEAGQPDALLIGGGQVIYVAYLRGPDAESLALIDAAMTTHEVPTLLAIRTLFLLKLGRDDEARTAYDELARLDFEAMFARDPLGASTLGLAVEAATHFGDRSALERFHPLVSGLRGQLVITGATVHLSGEQLLGVLLGGLDRWEEAEAAFAAGLAAARAQSSPYCVAWTLIEWARMLSRRGADDDEERARELALEALALCQPRGMRPLADTCTALIDATAGRGH